MDEREKLLKQFNDNYEMKKEEYNDVTPYKATTNLNTALNQPNMNTLNATKVNINNTGINNNMGIDSLMKSNDNSIPNDINSNNNNNNNNNNGNTINNNISVNNTSNDINNNMNTINNNIDTSTLDNNSLDVTERFYKEEPIYDKVTEQTTTYISNMEDIPKKKKISIKLSKDAQVFILIVVIILIFILILPTLSDFIKNIKNN